MDQKVIIIIVVIVLLCCSSSILGYFLMAPTTETTETTDTTDTEKKDKETTDTKKKDTSSTNIFKRSIESDPNCCGGDGGAPYEVICPEGTFVNQFYGGASGVIDRIGIRCSDGKTLGPHGGGGGVPFTIDSNSGFNKLKVKSGLLVDNITFVNTQGADIGVVGGGGGGGPIDLNCGDGKIMGLKLKAGGLLDRIQIVCGKEQ